MKRARVSSPIYITKRINLSKRNAWLIRIGGMLAAFLLSGILSAMLSPGSFGNFYLYMFKGTFSTTSYILNLLCCLSTYLLLSLAVTPAFKMKFWNIGGEGQALIGCIVCALILLEAPQSIPGPVVIILALVASIAAGAVWALIPTLFKVKFNTNETLFTLMMNYIATGLAAFTINKCTRGGSGIFPMITDESRLLVNIGGIKYLPFIFCAVLFTVVMIIYLDKSKHGFELSVMGDSTNTARYVGMSIKKITIRTMIISGAIAGLVGFLLVCGRNKTLTTTLVGGKGFTSVLIAWLGHFNPSEIAVYSFLVGFIDQGTTYAASNIGVSKNYFAGLILGLFILVVITSEFFVRYQVKRKLPNEISEIVSDIHNTNDAKMDKVSLLKVFEDINYINFKVKLSKNKQSFIKNKKIYYKERRKIKRQIVLMHDLKKKMELEEKLAIITKEYLTNKKTYSVNKRLSKIKRSAERSVVKANTSRIKRAIKNQIYNSLLVLKSEPLVFRTKEEFNNFVENAKFTKWQFNNDISYANIVKNRKKWVKEQKNLETKILKSNPISAKNIKTRNVTLFEYLVSYGDRNSYKFLKRAKKGFAFKAKIINRSKVHLENKKNRKLRKENKQKTEMK